MRITYEQRIAHSQNPTAKKLLQTMASKKTNLAVSADVTSAEELLELADITGPEICVLKTHIDVIGDFSANLTQKLQKLAEKHNFLIFEDRKFADIGNTVKLQYEQGIYRISSWADIINAHTLPGPGIIEGLKTVGQTLGRGLLLLAQMSSKDHLFSHEYTNTTVEWAEQHTDFVIGFITQKRLSPLPHLIHFTPGVQQGARGDSLGQQYITPHQAIVEQGNDVIIVGRGIYSDTNPLQAAKSYRQAGWEAYQQVISV
jgi:uridine monophosphate synthetase